MSITVERSSVRHAEYPLPLSTPERTITQRMEALVIANATRSSRSQLKRDIKARRVNVLDILEDPPADVLTMKLMDLLLAVPSLGRVKVTKALRDCAISPSRTVGGASPRQRDEVVRLLIWRR